MSAASEFCRLYEDAKQLGSGRFLLGVARVLPRLHAAAVALPSPDDADEIPDDDLDVDLTDEQMQRVASPVGDVLDEIDWDRIREHLPESRLDLTAAEAIEQIEQLHDDLRESGSPLLETVMEADWERIRANLRTYLPDRPPPERPTPVPIAAFLYDDLYDTYRDLKNGFRLLDAGRPEAEAVFLWELTFWAHWGYHSVDALRVIHYYVALYLGEESASPQNG